MPLARHRAMPLSEFSPEHRAEVDRLADAPEKPAKWLRLGHAEIQSRAWWEWHWRRGVDPDARREKISNRIREQVLARDGLQCQICGERVDPDDVHLDHIKPLSHGGETDTANLQVTHSGCNLRKGASWPG